MIKAPPNWWSSDASDDPELPENFAVEVKGTDGAKITFDRNRGQVRVSYELVTVE